MKVDHEFLSVDFNSWPVWSKVRDSCSGILIFQFRASPLFRRIIHPFSSPAFHAIFAVQGCQDGIAQFP